MEKIYRKTKTGFALLLSITLLASCGIKKKKAIQTDSSIVNSENFVRIFSDKASDWQLFSCKMKAEISSEGINMTSNINFRMKQDSLVWASLSVMGLEAARVLITSDSIYAMQKLPKKALMVKPIADMADFIGTSFTLNQLQNLILGNLVLAPNSYRWSGTPEEDIFYLKGKQDSIEITQQYYFKNIEPLQTLIRSLTSYNKATITYEGMQSTNLKAVPLKCTVKAEYAPSEKPIILKLDYSSPDFPKELRFPFTINSSYERITD